MMFKIFKSRNIIKTFSVFCLIFASVFLFTNSSIAGYFQLGGGSLPEWQIKSEGIYKDGIKINCNDIQTINPVPIPSALQRGMLIKKSSGGKLFLGSNIIANAVFTFTGIINNPAAVSLSNAVVWKSASENRILMYVDDSGLHYAEGMCENTYTVTFDKNGGDVEANPQQITNIAYNGNVGTLPTPPTKTGNTFAGWNTQSNGSGTTFTALTVVTGSITVYAQWTATLTVNVSSDAHYGDSWPDAGGTITSNPAGINCLVGTCNHNYDYNTVVILTATPVMDMTFQGWSGACSGIQSTCTVTMDQARSVTATFERLVVSVANPAVWAPNTKGGTVAFNPIGINTDQYNTYPCDDYNRYCRLYTVLNQQVILTATPFNSAYAFDYWSGDCSGTQPTCTVTMNQAKDVTVNFRANDNYTVTFDKNGGDVEANPQQITNIAYNGNVGTLPTPPTKTGNTFAGWNTQSNGSGTTFTALTVVTGSITVYAQWTANTYTVTLDKQGGTGGTNSVVATYGATMPAASAPTRTGYTFGGYYTATNGGGTQYYSNTMASVINWDIANNTTLYAKWTANTYKVRFDGNYATSGSMDDQSFVYDTPQYLTANGFEKTGYTFAGWATSPLTQPIYSDEALVNNLIANNSETITLYAKWNVIYYNVSYVVNNSVRGKINGTTNQTVAYGGYTTQVTAEANPGYTFAGWSDGNRNAYRFDQVFGTATYIAQFDEGGCSGGTGTQSDPYRICTPQDLYNIRNIEIGLMTEFSDAPDNGLIPRDHWPYFRLDMDIDLDHNTLSNDSRYTWYNDITGFPSIGAFMPDQHWTFPSFGFDFFGSFDGNGHTISNLYIQRQSTTDPNNLVPFTWNGIQYNTEGQDSWYDHQFSGLFGNLENVSSERSTIKNLTLSNPHVSYAGGFEVGLLLKYNVGVIDNVKVYNGFLDSRYYRDDVGGLVGTNRYIISNSFFRGTVSSSAQHAGGLIGSNLNGATIEKSFFEGNINNIKGDSSPRFVGGLVGLNYGDIIQSYSNGGVSDNDGQDSYLKLGGLVGSVGDCDNTHMNILGNITNSYAISTGHTKSGLVGCSITLGNTNTFNSYAIGPTKTEYGGLIYPIDPNSTLFTTVTNSYHDCSGSTPCPYDGTGSMTGIYGRRNSNMKLQATYNNWDFSPLGIWGLNSSINSGYPYLRNNSPIQ